MNVHAYIFDCVEPMLPSMYDSLEIWIGLMPGHARGSDEREELLARLLLGPEATQHGGGNCGRAGLLDTAHRHAHVASLHHDGDTTRADGLHDGQGDLLCEAFLNLKAAREGFGDTSELAESEDELVGDVADRDLAGERDEVVLAEREDVNVTDDDHLLVVLGEDGIVDHVNQTLLVSLRHPHERLGVTLRSAEEALTVGVLADTLKNSSEGSSKHLEVLRLLLRRRLETEVGALS